MAEEQQQPEQQNEAPQQAPAPQQQVPEAQAQQSPASESPAPEAAAPVQPADQAAAGKAPAPAARQARAGRPGGPGAGRAGRGGRPGGGRAGGGRPGRGRERERDRGDETGVESSVVRIYRCSKVVKGGRTFSFGALVVCGDRRGNVGIGYGKANEVPPAVEKATKDARKQMFRVNLKGTTIPHQVRGIAGASTIILVPARPGTGVTAGKSVRPVVELAGITDVLTKAYGSTSPKNLVKATITALKQLQNRDQVQKSRGVELPAGAGELVTT